MRREERRKIEERGDKAGKREFGFLISFAKYGMLRFAVLILQYVHECITMTASLLNIFF